MLEALQDAEAINILVVVKDLLLLPPFFVFSNTRQCVLGLKPHE
jgi:hypothetical protein